MQIGNIIDVQGPYSGLAFDGDMVQDHASSMALMPWEMGLADMAYEQVRMTWHGILHAFINFLQVPHLMTKFVLRRELGPHEIVHNAIIGYYRYPMMAFIYGIMACMHESIHV